MSYRGLEWQNDIVNCSWQYQKQLGESTKIFYGHYIYLEDLYNELVKIHDYYLAHDIEMVLIIPPTHVDLQNKVADYGADWSVCEV